MFGPEFLAPNRNRSAGTVSRPMWRRLFQAHPQPEAPSVPGNDGLRLDDDERRSPSGPDARELAPERTVCLREPRPPRPSPWQHLQLVPQRQDFELKRSARPRRLQQRSASVVWQRDSARQTLRGFLGKIVIPSGDGLLQVVGNLGAMLAAAQGRNVASQNAVGYVGCGGAQPPELAEWWVAA
jgi:hypothetical protein